MNREVLDFLAPPIGRRSCLWSLAMEQMTLSELQLVEYALQALPDHPEAKELRQRFADAIRARTQGAHALHAADFVGAAPSHT
jgi:hypothetical protein